MLLEILFDNASLEEYDYIFKGKEVYIFKDNNTEGKIALIKRSNEILLKFRTDIKGFKDEFFTGYKKTMDYILFLRNVISSKNFFIFIELKNSYNEVKKGIKQIEEFINYLFFKHQFHKYINIDKNKIIGIVVYPKKLPKLSDEFSSLNYESSNIFEPDYTFNINLENKSLEIDIYLFRYTLVEENNCNELVKADKNFRYFLRRVSKYKSKREKEEKCI